MTVDERGCNDASLRRPRNKAGRNVPVAIIVGVILGALIVGGLCIPNAWYPLLSVVIGLATWEVTHRLKEHDYDVSTLVILIGGQLMLWLSLPWGAEGMVIGYIVSVGAIFITRLFNRGRYQATTNYLRDMAVAVFVLTWISLCGTAAAHLSLYHQGHVRGWALIVTFILCVVGNDVGGFAAGVFFGKHPLAPAVSPKKSVEGFVGSLILAATVGAVTTWLLLQRAPWEGVVVGLVLACAATLGDLVESQFKRELGIKDMSSLIPEHGGLMDRLDSLLPAAAMTWVLATFIQL
ncbi:phosphatidate cytidylyltransferase [Corynebacterium kroppenstedtii]|uniref:phosphatidate cytidylyltransferase n=1 Tax=Corynebacterium sp. PCR 32 TaxID=3351342 RepID=UPI00309D52A1